MLLGPRAALPHRPQRVLLAGGSGAGKTTAARRVARVLGVEHVEIDALFHGEHWTPRPTFEDDVRAFTARPTWVTEWQYGLVRPLLAHRADLLVWLDLPRAVVMRQLVVRTLRRRARREVLWNGNVEPPLRTLLTDPEHVLRWGWSTWSAYPRRVGDLLEREPHLVVVRLGSRRELDAWVAGPLARSRDASAPPGR